jgi:hypothetical protein
MFRNAMVVEHPKGAEAALGFVEVTRGHRPRVC